MNWVSFKRIQKSEILYLVDKKPNTFLKCSDLVIRNEYQWQNIRIWFLITPIQFTPTFYSLFLSWEIKQTKLGIFLNTLYILLIIYILKGPFLLLSII